MQSLFDGPNKVKKRWAITIAAIAGVVQTFEHLPTWVHQLAAFIATVV